MIEIVDRSRALLRAAAAALAITACMWSGHAASETPKDTIILSGGVDITAINPLDTFAVLPDRSLLDHLSDSLMRWATPTKLEPWLAESWTLIDDTTWEFKLRKGIKFSNGEPVTAESFKLFFDTIIDPNTKSSQRAFYANVIKEIQVVDEHTFRLVTQSPAPALLPRLMMAIPIPPQYFKSVGLAGYRAKPVFSGPYLLTEFVKDDHATLRARDDYWGGPQQWKTIVYRPILESAARIAALATGEIDLAIDVPPELQSMAERYPGVQIKKALSTRFFVIQLSNKQDSYPTKHRAVREAIAYGIDRESLARDLLGGAGVPAAWNAIGSFGENTALKPYPYDPERAKKLLAEAGVPNGIDLEFDAPSGRYIKDKEVAQAIAGQLAKANIRVRVNITEWGLLSKRVFSRTTAPLTLLAWGNPDQDPESHNRNLLRSDGSFTQFSDPALDAIVDKASVEMDPEKRKAYLFELQDYQRKEVPMIYVNQIGMIVGVSKKLADWQLRPDERIYFVSNNVVR